MAVGSAVLLVLLIGVHASIGSDPRDDVSFDAGYRAASNGTLIREAMAAPRTTSAALCNSLVKRAFITHEPPHIVQDDFISGCTRAVAEAME